MKYNMLLLMLLSVSAGFSQTTTSKLPPVTDTFATNLLASTASFIRLAENPKKDIAFFTQDLRETNTQGQPVYAAAFPFPGFSANVRKIDVDRISGLSTWMWAARFAEAPRGKNTAAIKTLIARADSLLQFFKSHAKYDGGTHKIIAFGVYDNFGWASMPNEFAEITVRFNKPSAVTEQQAYDSLVSLYKPLLFEIATAKECTEKLGNAFTIERIPKEKVTAFFTKCIKAVADKSVETAFDVMMAMPVYINAQDVKAQLTSGQQASIKAMATKWLAEFDAREQRRINGVETVTAQHQKQQQEKQANECQKMNRDVFFIKYQAGLAVQHKSYKGGETGWISAVDCNNEMISITVPGVKGFTANTINKIKFIEYEKDWDRVYEKFSNCSRCGGEGGETITETKTRVKELPFGYFDGIITTSTKTTTRKIWLQCEKCRGTGYALEKR